MHRTDSEYLYFFDDDFEPSETTRLDTVDDPSEHRIEPVDSPFRHS